MRLRQGVVVLALGLLVSLVTVGAAWADDAEPAEDTKKVNKDLEIDWGTDEKPDEKKKDDPDAAAPSKEVDLETALTEAQTKRLDVIKKAAAKGDEMAAVADEIATGEKRGVKKEASVRQYENASGVYLRASGDLERFAKSIQDEDVRLTLLRTYGDVYKSKACEMLCKAAGVAIETAGGKMDNLKGAVKLLKRARGIDPSYSGIAMGLEDVKSAYNDIQAKIVEAKAREASAAKSGEDEEKKSYDTGRPEREKHY
jgi:hypothetical protein